MGTVISMRKTLYSADERSQDTKNHANEELFYTSFFYCSTISAHKEDVSTLSFIEQLYFRHPSQDKEAEGRMLMLSRLLIDTPHRGRLRLVEEKVPHGAHGVLPIDFPGASRCKARHGICCCPVIKNVRNRI